MTTDALQPQERIARELLTQRPLFVGRVDDKAVFWDGYERAFAIVRDDGQAQTLALSETGFTTPLAFCEHIEGWDVGPRLGGSLLDDLRPVMEAVE